MTIFDTLRYPINSCPTEEQLRALPPRLFRRWASKVQFGRQSTIRDVARWYNSDLIAKTGAMYIGGVSEPEIQLLRDMIRRKR